MWEHVEDEGQDPTWLLEALKNGSAVMVTDGSFDRKRAPLISGAGWEITCRKSRKFLKGSFFKISNSASAYRGEVLGLLALHTLIFALAQFHKMEEVIEQVKEGEMPLNSYTWTHTDSRLTPNEKNALTQWAQQVMDTLKANHPLDSLIRPKKPTPPKTTSNENAEHRPDADDRRERPGTN